MKPCPSKLVISLVSTALLLSFGLPLLAEDHQAMHDASDALRAAQVAADPVAKLQEAARHLRQGRPNKQGYRVSALKHTNDAIEAIKAGKRVDANKAIQQALSEIQKAVTIHPRDNKQRK